MKRVVTDTGAIRAWWSLAMVLATAVVISMANVAYTNHVADEAERRQTEQKARDEQARKVQQVATLRVFCRWLEPKVDPEPAPMTARGRQQLVADQEFYRFLQCGKVK